MIPPRTLRRRTARRVLAVAVSAAAVATSVLATASPAAAADPTPFIVVGTSDVYDSNLIQSAIEPGFEAAYPQYDLQYVSKGTSAAIAYAKTGSADALVVHAASLENQFVADGYSTEAYGRAAFWGDYVLLGPNNDPVHVGTDHPHDIVSAFEEVAAAGAAGDANFVSRAAAPGTTVQEHDIWSRSSSPTKCNVSSDNGGGQSPSTTSGNCPTNIDYPSWYHSGDRTQALNVENADVCSYNGGNCYVLTDRGTYQYLKSTNAISNLKIVTRNNDATARGGIPELVNSFHIYGINAAKVGGARTIQTQAAADFLNYVTSADGQAKVKAFLASDPDGSPFIPDAAPAVATAAIPAGAYPGAAVTISGAVANVVPGAPRLAGKTVTVTSALSSSPDAPKTAFATTTTDANGHFSVTYHAVKGQNRVFGVTVPPITQIENATLNPVFGDLLQRTTVASIGSVTVLPGAITSLAASAVTPGVLHLSGTLAPAVRSTSGRVFLYTRTAGSTGAFTYRDAARPKAGSTTFSYDYKLAKGPIEYRLVYEDQDNFTPQYTRTYSTTIR